LRQVVYSKSNFNVKYSRTVLMYDTVYENVRMT